MPDRIGEAAADPAARPFTAADYHVPGVYLAAAARHPLPTRVAARLCAYADQLATCPIAQGLDAKQAIVCAAFARMVGAHPGEIAAVSGTVTTESLLLGMLGLHAGDGAIVTDALHFARSLRLYDAMARNGIPVTVLPATQGRIDYDRLEDRLAARDVALVAVSSVSHHNGFRHDLREVCSLAHRHGALVYADLIQHAGVLPIDVRQSGVDFAACSSFKWLLGDTGFGFFYARRDRWAKLRAVAQPAGESALAAFMPPGTLGAGAVEALLASLPHTAAFMAGDPERTWRPLTMRMEAAFGALGLEPLSPPDLDAPIRAYADPRINAAGLAELGRQGIHLSGRDGYLRMSPSVYNTPAQIDEAAAALVDMFGLG